MLRAWKYYWDQVIQYDDSTSLNPEDRSLTRLRHYLVSVSLSAVHARSAVPAVHARSAVPAVPALRFGGGMGTRFSDVRAITVNI